MKHIKNKNTIKPQNRQKQPDKIHQKKTHNKIKKQKPQKQSWQVLIILCFPNVGCLIVIAPP